MQTLIISLEKIKKVVVMLGIILASMPWSATIFAATDIQRNTKFDPTFGLPIPPVLYEGGGYVNPTNIRYAIIMFICIWLAGFLWGLWDSIKTKSLLPVFISLTGFVCVLPEIVLDIMSAVIYCNNENTVVFTLMGRHMNWEVIMGWAGFGGLFGMASFKFFSTKGIKTRNMWLALLIVCIGQLILEEGLGYVQGIYYYYGHQPLAPFTQFGWWVILPTSGGVCLYSALAYRFRSVLQGWRALGILILAPMAWLGFLAGTSWPAWIAINSDLPWLVNQLLGLATVAYGLLGFVLLMKLVLQRNPFDLDDTGVEFE